MAGCGECTSVSRDHEKDKTSGAAGSSKVAESTCNRPHDLEAFLKVSLKKEDWASEGYEGFSRRTLEEEKRLVRLAISFLRVPASILRYCSPWFFPVFTSL